MKAKTKNIRIRNILAKYERALRELQSDLCDQVQAGDITDEQANEWANEKADQWASEADAEILAVGCATTTTITLRGTGVLTEALSWAEAAFAKLPHGSVCSLPRHAHVDWRETLFHDDCWLCGRSMNVTASTKWILVGGEPDGYLLPHSVPADALVMEVNSLGLYPVGNACARRLPSAFTATTRAALPSLLEGAAK